MKTDTIIILAVIGVIAFFVIKKLDKGVEVKHGLDLGSLWK